MPKSAELVSSGEAARILGVSPRQIARLANEGVLEPVYRGHGVTGAFVFDADAVSALAEQRQRGAT